MTRKIRTTAGTTVGTLAASLLLGLGIGIGPAGAQDAANQAAANQATANQDGGTGNAAQDEPPRAKPRGRLPHYFSQLVTPAQREEIYQLQARFAEEIAKLEAAIVAKEQERDAAVDAVLTPDQLTRVKELREAARQRREARRKQTDDGESSRQGARSRQP